MKILCVSDVIDPLVYSVNAKTRYGDVDLVLSAGDLPERYYEFIISATNKTLYYVNGNHHGIHPKRGLGEIDDQVKPYFGECVDGKVVYDKKRDLIIAGLGGSMLYNNGPDQYSEFAMRRRISRMIPTLYANKIKYGRYVDILLTHASPFGVNDDKDLCHTGFKCFNWFIKQFKPSFVLHGHMHLTDENKRPIVDINETKVINIYKNYMLEIKK